MMEPGNIVQQNNNNNNATAPTTGSFIPTTTFQLNPQQANQVNVNVVTQQGSGSGSGGHPSSNAQHTTTATFSLTNIDSYEEVFKEITKKLYGDDQGFAELIDASNIQQANIIYDTDAFRTSVEGSHQGVTFLAAPNGTLPPGTIVLQRKLCQDKDGRYWSMEGVGDQVTLVPEQQQQIIQTTTPVPTSTSTAAAPPAPPVIEERWFESEEVLSWSTSKIARYNPTQKVFRCVDCDFVGFLSRVAEHWLGNHASLRVFQCPRCPYTSAWARCVRMHLTRQHGETINDNSMWKENPVLEEVTKYLGSLKSGVEARLLEGEERRYLCPYCPYTTDRRDLYNRHENIHREAKPFQCYVCDKQFNRADHVKKHFTRMHRDHPYDINKIKKQIVNKTSQQSSTTSRSSSSSSSKATKQQQQREQQQRDANAAAEAAAQLQVQQQQQQQILDTGQQHATISLQLDSSTGQTVTIPHISYFNPPSTPGQSGPLQGIAGVGGTKKESKSKHSKVKKKAGEKMYTCSYCPWQGVDNWCLKRHLNTHIKPFLCALCDYKAARSERLATHVLKVHNKRVCHKCSFLADDTDALSQHIQDAHQNPLVKTGFNCNVCQEYFELRADLEAHAILEHQKVIVQCDLCDFRTTDELSMEAHLREKHNLQPGMGAVAAAAAAAQSLANNNSSSTFQMHLPTQQQMQIPDTMSSLDQHHQSLQSLINSGGDPLNQSANNSMVSAADNAMHSITFQQQQQHDGSTNNGTANSSTRRGGGGGGDISNVSSSGAITGDSLLVDGGGGQENAAQAAGGVDELPVEESEPETLCEKCGIEFADEASLKLHEKRHWKDETSDEKDATAVSTAAKKQKNIIRSYICSTCSYTASTKRLIMQHQRAHNGLELVCKAEACMFSTPFDNTLKEHIHSEHAAEPNVRCPHCGLKIPSTNAFHYHWRSHHRSLCSLCVNLYRLKYGIKENDLHEVISKSMLQLLNEDMGGGGLNANNKSNKPGIQIKEDDNDKSKAIIIGSVDAELGVDNHHLSQTFDNQQQSEGIIIKMDDDGDDASLDDCLNNNNNLLLSPSQDLSGGGGDAPPPKKKPKLELLLDFSPILSALERKKNRESLKIIPNLSEVLVTPVISSHQLKAIYNNGSSPKDQLQSWTKLRHPSRRLLYRSSPSWLFRRMSATGEPRGRKCHHVECVESPVARRSFKRSSELVLHQLWHHSKAVHSCDVCPSKFLHLYQALLHKIRQHPEEHVRDQAQAVLLLPTTTTTHHPQDHELQNHIIQQTQQIDDFSSAEELLFHNNQESHHHHDVHNNDHIKQQEIVFKPELLP